MSFRTDLAIEAAKSHIESNIKGILQTERSHGDITISTVEILNEAAEKLVGKPKGKYITVTAPSFSGSLEISEEDINVIANEIRSILPKDGLVLVVGLGNNDITPDAIGPRTARQILATRHLGDDIKAQSGLSGLRAAATLAPGVLGQTGIETAQIIKSLVNELKPSAVIAIDALAARSVSRLGNTIQISNAGISPGSGVMNARKELSQNSLGVPVVSIGIPTVVDATTLASDLLENAGDDLEKRRSMFEPEGSSLMITPREIDVLIGHACKTLSLSINKALQPGLSLEEIGYLVS